MGRSSLAKTTIWRWSAATFCTFRVRRSRCPEDERELLRSTGLSSSSHHKNIAYRPAEDKVTGFDPAAVSDPEQLRAVMRSYSERALAFLWKLLPRYMEKARDRFRELPAAGGGGPRSADQEAQRSAARGRISDAADARRHDPAILHQYSSDRSRGCG